MLLSDTIVDFNLFYDGDVDIQIWPHLTRSQCKVSDTQVTVKACGPLVSSKNHILIQKVFFDNLKKNQTTLFKLFYLPHCMFQWLRLQTFLELGFEYHLGKYLFDLSFLDILFFNLKDTSNVNKCNLCIFFFKLYVYT